MLEMNTRPGHLFYLKAGAVEEKESQKRWSTGWAGRKGSSWTWKEKTKMAHVRGVREICSGRSCLANFHRLYGVGKCRQVKNQSTQSYQPQTPGPQQKVISVTSASTPRRPPLHNRREASCHNKKRDQGVYPLLLFFSFWVRFCPGAQPHFVAAK
jgi:hypothetical protein